MRADKKDAFQSTPLMRGETRQTDIYSIIVNISIHSPHARGDNSRNLRIIDMQISIHSPHARGDNIIQW